MKILDEQMMLITAACILLGIYHVVIDVYFNT